eukprot:m.63766 g.63766  ORF g.63766 m.63766 type:complete len:125 (-) comp49674_c0_seq1:128-502(-)
MIFPLTSPDLGFVGETQAMLHPDPESRPSAAEIIAQPYFVADNHPMHEKSRDQLLQELLAEKERSYQLERELAKLKVSAKSGARAIPEHESKAFVTHRHEQRAVYSKSRSAMHLARTNSVPDTN